MEVLIMKRYFSWNGRINRLRYFLSAIVCSAALMALVFPIVFIFSGGRMAMLFVYALLVPFWYVGLCLTIQRCHDLNKSGFFSLLMFIPIVCFFWGLYLTFAKGTDGTNSYGLDPLIHGYSSSPVDEYSPS